MPNHPEWLQDENLKIPRDLIKGSGQKPGAWFLKGGLLDINR
jgi:hypothetical protein